jgi:hypothetical protein
MAYSESDDPYGLMGCQDSEQIDPATGLPRIRITDPDIKSNYPYPPSDVDTTPAPEPAPTPASTNPIPTNPDGSQVGSGIPWTPGASEPSSAPPGYRWNNDLAMYVLDGSSTGSTGPQNGDWQGWFSTLTSGKAPTPDQLIALEPQIVAAGGKVLRNAKGVAGKIQLPNGDIIDVIQGADAGGKAWQWITPQQAAANNSASGGSGGGGFLDRLSQLLDQYQNPVDPNDPIISRLTQSYEGRMGRALEGFKNQAAERAYAEGVPSGAFDTQIGNATLEAGRNVGDFEGNLLNTEHNNRRNALAQLLGLTSSYSLGNTGLFNQNNQFYDKLGIDSAHEEALLKYLYDQLKLS